MLAAAAAAASEAAARDEAEDYARGFAPPATPGTDMTAGLDVNYDSGGQAFDEAAIFASQVNALNGLPPGQQFLPNNDNQHHVGMDSNIPLSSMLQQLEQEHRVIQEQQELQHQQLLQSRNQEDLQKQLQKHLQRQLQEQLAAASAAAAAAKAAMVQCRPEEHFLTIAQNGTILGATETITGVPAQSLLMQSIFDSVHPDDIIGLQAIATRYWDKGDTDVEAYFRRRTVEGDWVSLSAKIITVIEDPVSGFVLRECLAKDEIFAIEVRRMSQISALLASAVEEAYLKKKEAESSGLEGDIANLENTFPGFSAIPGIADDLAALQALMANTDGNGFDPSNGMTSLQALVEAAESGGGNITGSNRMNNQSKNGSNSTDDAPISVREIVRSGACLDLSKISLTDAEIKFVTLVLTGRVNVEDVGSLLVNALNIGKGLEFALQNLSTVKESQQAEEEAIAAALRERQRSKQGRRESSRHRHKPTNAKILFDHQRLLGNSSSNKSDTSVYSFTQNGVLPPSPMIATHPPLAVLNLSYTNLGNQGMEMLCEILYVQNPYLKTLDLGFCNVEERGFLALSRAIRLRKKKNLPNLEGLILSGNALSYKSAKELGSALSSAPVKERKNRRVPRKTPSPNTTVTGYEDDDEYDVDDDDEDDALFGMDSNSKRRSDSSGKPRKQKQKPKQSAPKPIVAESNNVANNTTTLQFLHLACSSLSPDSLHQLLLGLGPDCPIRDLSIASNKIGPTGAKMFVSFLEGKSTHKFQKGSTVMPNLDRLDISNNCLGNDGTAQLTRAISKRIKVNLVNLKLSSNGIGSLGIETIMNKILQHNLVLLSLDNNKLGDRGCQLVAASLRSMHHLTQLNLNFNQIGSRGITALMRAVVSCESITSLGLSGNVMKVSGSIAMGFALAQHPRLAEIEMDNCCLSQVAQCHIVSGIISNRWVPMRNVYGFQAGPPMVAIGAMDHSAQKLCNEECFRIRRDIQMKNILQWMQDKNAPHVDETHHLFADSDDQAGGAPSQSAYLRMFEWLRRIPFDEDEFTDLQAYFFDTGNVEGEDGMGSYGIDLKHRGDLLAVLGSEILDEIREASPLEEYRNASVVGLNLDSWNLPDEEDGSLLDVWKLYDNEKILQQRNKKDESILRSVLQLEAQKTVETEQNLATKDRERSMKDIRDQESGKKRQRSVDCIRDELLANRSSNGISAIRNSTFDSSLTANLASIGRGSMSSVSKTSVTSSRSGGSIGSGQHRSRRRNKTRISMFPRVAANLETLKAEAQELMDREHDPVQQDVIAQLFAEASLTLLRQLRYHCMKNGLDGWRQGNRRKVLIVDDSLVTRKMVSRAFEKANFIVDTAENGKEGVQMLKACIYDIAFMDIDMPVMNGFDATKELRQWEDEYRPGARQPICALTAAYVDDFERSELMKFKDAGLDVMESKPCNIPRLLKVVDDVSPMFSDLTIASQI